MPVLLEISDPETLEWIDPSERNTMRLEVTIPDQLYSEAKRSAAAGGFGSMDAYVADLISHDIQPESDNDDHFFTAEVVAEIHEAAAAARTGDNVSLDQFRAEAKIRNAAWRATHPG